MTKPKILKRKVNLPTVTVEANVAIGSYVEESGEEGYAHFIEHLLLEGTKTRDAFQIAKEIEEVGGEINASTTIERTRFYAKVPAIYAQKAIDIISDVISNPSFKEDVFEKEKKVVLSEIRMYKDDPKLVQWELIESNLFDSSLKNSVLGTEESIKNSTIEKIKNFYEKHYVSENVAISIVGNFEELKENFDLPQGKTSFNCVEGENKSKLIVKKRKIEQTYLLFGWKVPKRSDKNSILFDVYQSHLGRGASGKLFHELRNKRGVGYSVFSTNEPGVSVGAFFIGVTTEKPDEVKELVGNILKEELNEEDLKLAKTHLLGSKMMREEDSRNISNDVLNWESSGDVELAKSYEKIVEQLTLEEINGILIGFNNPTIVEIRPL